MGDQAMTVRAVTRELAAYAVGTRFEDHPAAVQAEAPRAFLNWMGCVLGGCREPGVTIAAEAALETGGAPQAMLIGLDRRSDIATAAFINCLSSSMLAFDDTHLSTVTHPTGPPAAAILAESERRTVTGPAFLDALILGIEVQCRLSAMLLLPPARANLNLYITGITGPIGTAVALGKLQRLDETRMAWAIGLAAAQAAGFRGTHGGMSGLFVPAHASRCGVSAALLAARGFTCPTDIIESDKGFAAVYAESADLDLAVDGLGGRYELVSNAYKPYPSGIVVHPAIDACLEIVEQFDGDTAIAEVTLHLHPLALALADRRHPATPLEAQISLQHWAAAVLLSGSAGPQHLQQDTIDRPETAVLRDRVTLLVGPGLTRDEAIAEVVLVNGRRLRAHVPHARGSLARPMTDEELDAKFRLQAEGVIGTDGAAALLGLCRAVAGQNDVGGAVRAALTSYSSGPMS